MVCLETDFLVALLRIDREAVSKLAELTTKNVALFMTPISLTELFKGAFKSGKEEKFSKVEELSAALKLLVYDFYASKEAGKLLNFLERNGKKIGDMDTLTAAIALRHRERLLTRNEKHFNKVRGLEIEKW